MVHSSLVCWGKEEKECRETAQSIDVIMTKHVVLLKSSVLRSSSRDVLTNLTSPYGRYFFVTYARKNAASKKTNDVNIMRKLELIGDTVDRWKNHVLLPS